MSATPVFIGSAAVAIAQSFPTFEVSAQSREKSDLIQGKKAISKPLVKEQYSADPSAHVFGDKI